MVYTPSKPPAVSDTDAQALASYLNDELQVIASSLRTQDPIQMVVSNKAPSRPRTGLIVYADGVNWNPGSGEGAYSYGVDGLWHPLFRAPKVAAFSVKLNGNQTITSGAFVKILFDTVDFDTNSWWDATNHRFNPKIAGHYLLTGTMNNFASTSPTTTVGTLYINGTEYTRESQMVSGVTGATGSIVVHLNGSTDYAEYWALIVGATAVINGSPYFPRFTGALLRAD